MTRILVTGGGGFLGQAIVKQLLAKNYQVVIFNRRPSPELAALGVTCIQGDITQASAVAKAAKGCDAIIHTAAKAGVWGPAADYHAINVDGTRNVLAACEAHKISKLVYTSSPSVIFDGKNHGGIDESAPYPKAYQAAYPKTKAEAERLVLEAHSKDLQTTALRPHLIWGPGDPHLAPRLIDRARKKRLKFIGDGENLVDSVYVDNAAHAHILALEKLGPDSPIAGRVYFITNHEPWPIRRLVNELLKSAAGLAPVNSYLPRSIGMFAGGLCEFIYRAFRLKQEPPLTRFVVKQLSSQHWYNPERSQTELGYRPIVSMTEGMQRLSQRLR